MRQNYRKIWESHHGPIPNDQLYDIHHVDGNRSNNNISNLQLVTLQEHYDIHFAQGNYWACQAISIRLKIPQDEQVRLYKLAAQERTGIPRPDIMGDKNPMRRPEVALAQSHAKKGILKADSTKKSMSESAKVRAAIKYHCEYCNANVSKLNYLRWHGNNCVNSNTPKPRITNFVLNNPNNQSIKCEHCGKIVITSNYYRWHGDNCNKSATGSQRITNFNTSNPSKILHCCEHCGKQVSTGNYYRWHHDNCKRNTHGIC